MVMIAFSGCAARDKQDQNQKQKSLSLGEYLEESNENWFLTGKKEYTIQAMIAKYTNRMAARSAKRTLQKRMYLLTL